MSEKKFCPNCGKKLENGESFCSNCGAKIETQKETDTTSKKKSRESKKGIGKKIGIAAGIIIVLWVILSLIPSGKKETGEKQDVAAGAEVETESESQTAESEQEKTDLYTLRKATEEVLVDKFGWEKNEYGMYPNESNPMIMCIDGVVYTVTLTEHDKEQYSFLGVSVGDNYQEAKAKLEKFYTYIDTYAQDGNEFSDSFADNEFGALSVNYDMNTSEIKSIGYVAEEIPGAPEAETEQDIADIADADYSLYEYEREDILQKYGEDCEYAIEDIDEDGISELIVSYGTCDADWRNDVYTLDDGLLYLGTFYRPVTLFLADQEVTSDGQGIIAVSGHMGVENIDQIVKNGDELLVTTVENRELDPDEDYYGNEWGIEMRPITNSIYQ